MAFRHAIPLALLLTACAPTAGPTFYLLEAPPSAARVEVSAQTIGLREVALPLYARRQQMAVLSPAGEVLQSEDRRWADEPPRAVTRTVARTLGTITGRTVAVEPWPTGVRPDVHVQVQVDVLIGELPGVLRLEGEIRVTRLDRRRQIESTPFAISVDVAGADHADLADAHGIALTRLAEGVADALTAR